jgi:two-component system cell cycle sensor histidine kinase/response regulator CckA
MEITMALTEQLTAHSTATRTAPLQEATSPGQRPLRVLAIDDNDDFRMLVKEMMEARGYEIETANNPMKALEMFRTSGSNYDLVLLDYYMPQLDGGKTCEWLRRFNPQVKIIICSGADEFHLRQMQAKYQIDGYIHKPFRLDEAEFVIQQVLRR